MQSDLSNRDYCRSWTVHTSSRCQKNPHALIFNNHCGVIMVDSDALPAKSACWHSTCACIHKNVITLERLVYVIESEGQNWLVVMNSAGVRSTCRVVGNQGDRSLQSWDRSCAEERHPGELRRNDRLGTQGTQVEGDKIIISVRSGPRLWLAQIVVGPDFSNKKFTDEK